MQGVGVWYFNWVGKPFVTYLVNVDKSDHDQVITIWL